jgi:hypothetical protein
MSSYTLPSCVLLLIAGAYFSHTAWFCVMGWLRLHAKGAGHSLGTAGPAADARCDRRQAGPCSGADHKLFVGGRSCGLSDAVFAVHAAMQYHFQHDVRDPACYKLSALAALVTSMYATY